MAIYVGVKVLVFVALVQLMVVAYSAAGDGDINWYSAIPGVLPGAPFVVAAVYFGIVGALIAAGVIDLIPTVD